KTNSLSYNVNFKTEIDSLGSELIVDADYISFKRTAENYNYNSFINGNNTPYRNAYSFRNGSPADINIKTAKTDFTKVYNTTFKVETGAKYSAVENNNYLKVDSLNSSNAWVKDNNRTNTFIYKEKIAAVYFNFTKDWKKISLQMGVRVENTNYSGNSVTLNQVKDSNYTNLFPSAFLTYRQNEKNTWNASYSRRINRPSYQSLNPFIDFIDPYTQFEGNPNLKPSFTQSFEVKHSYNDFLYSTLSYSYTKAQSTNVILQDKVTGRVRNITANVGNSSYLSLNFSASVQPYKWWSIDNNVSFSGGNSQSNYPEYEFDQNYFGVDVSTEHSFTLPQKIKIQTSAYYSTPYRDGITKIRASYIVSAGVQKSLWKSKASIKINYNNIIGPSAYRAQYLSDNLNIKWINQWEGRRINISFNYKFGNANVKASRQRSSASQQERNRVNL
ncbi:MAG: outer membrane beta-barrel family protein, partial [Ferruginibacter sp.]